MHFAEDFLLSAMGGGDAGSSQRSRDGLCDSHALALPELLGDSLHAKDASWSIVKNSASSKEKYLEYVLLCLVSH